MYPDIEIAHELCSESIYKFFHGTDSEEEEMQELDEAFDDELRSILDDFGSYDEEEDDNGLEDDDEEAEEEQKKAGMTVENMFSFIDARLSVTNTDKVKLPFYELCKKLELGHFSVFALAAAILSSTQTSYASVFQVVNENGNLVAPTVESAGRMYFGDSYSITTAYSEMSVCLEKLLPIMD